MPSGNADKNQLFFLIWKMQYHDATCVCATRSILQTTFPNLCGFFSLAKRVVIFLAANCCWAVKFSWCKPLHWFSKNLDYLFLHGQYQTVLTCLSCKHLDPIHFLKVHTKPGYSMSPSLPLKHPMLLQKGHDVCIFCMWRLNLTRDGDAGHTLLLLKGHIVWKIGLEILFITSKSVGHSTEILCWD